MGILVSLAAGLVIWVVLWALQVKAFDALLLLLLILVVAVALRTISPFLPGNRGNADDPRSGGTWRYR